MGYFQKFGSPFLYNEATGQVAGVVNPDGTSQFFAFTLPEAVTPVDGVKATLTTDMTAGNSDVTLTAVDYGDMGNRISVTYVDPDLANASLSVSVSGTAITVSLATNAGKAITSTCALVVAAINASTAASALVVATGEGTKAGVVNAVALANLEGGVTCTPGAVGTFADESDGSILYRKVTEQTWKAYTADVA